MTVADPVMQSAQVGISTSDPQASLLAALRPFALAGLEGSLSHGELILVHRGEVQARLTQADFVRAYLAWSIHDPASRAAILFMNPDLPQPKNDTGSLHEQKAALADDIRKMSQESLEMLKAAETLHMARLKLALRSLGLGIALGIIIGNLWTLALI